LYITSGSVGGFDFGLNINGTTYYSYAPTPAATNSWFINNTFVFTGLPAGSLSTSIYISAWNACQITFQAYAQPVSYNIVELG
jgi:hypothetical protein